MNGNAWTWANLTGEQLRLLNLGEETLGADILLAYQPHQRSQVVSDEFANSGLQVAPLNESQLECLQGLETKLQAVVIAYQQVGA